MTYLMILGTLITITLILTLIASIYFSYKFAIVLVGIHKMLTMIFTIFEQKLKEAQTYVIDEEDDINYM